jgi:hypothetical protein
MRKHRAVLEEAAFELEGAVPLDFSLEQKRGWVLFLPTLACLAGAVEAAAAAQQGNDGEKKAAAKTELRKVLRVHLG